MALVADTHAAVWWLTDDPRLSMVARQAMDQTIHDQEPVYVSSISIVEVIYLVDKKRLDESALTRLVDALSDPAVGLAEIPLDSRIAQTMRRVPRENVPDMPDRIIGATALHLGLRLVTRDHRIQVAGLDTIW